VAKLYSAASHHYVRPNDQDCLDNIKNYIGPSVTQPDSTQLQPSSQGLLTLSNALSTDAQKATILPNLKSSTLISLGQICDDNCSVLLNKNKLYAVKDDDITYNFDRNNFILEGSRNPNDGLWDIPLHKRKILTNIN